VTNSTASARRVRILGTVATGLLLFAGCGSSAPSVKRVALEVVETLDATPEQRECMREKVEAYSNDQLEAMVPVDDEGNAIEIDFRDPTSIPDATPELQQFVDDLRACIT
jgi:outer membrane murein-binding lipoprotein Lpp